MFASLASIAALMLSTLLMMVGFGLMNYLLPIRSLAEGWSTFTISVIATGYTFGFTMSCIITPIFVRRVGHVRVFGALITLLTVSILLCSLVVEWWAWMLIRGLSGFAIAGAYLLIESWLNEQVTNDTRGATFSVYMVTALVGSIAGQYIVPFGDPSTTALFIICALIFSLAMFPVALSTAKSPNPIAEARFDLKRLYRRSPLAFFGSLLSGALSGTWGSLGGVYSQNIGLTTGEGATLLAVILAGGSLSQVPIGKLSDRVDRRFVMIGAGLFGVAACLLMMMFDRENTVMIYVAGFFVGTVLYPVYSLNVAHANDLAEPHEYVTVSSAIMILYGLGTVTGPLMAGSLMEYMGPNALIWFLGCAFALYAGYATWRITRRLPSEGPGTEEKSDFQAMPIPLQGTDPASVPNAALNAEDEVEPRLL